MATMIKRDSQDSSFEVPVEPAAPKRSSSNISTRFEARVGEFFAAWGEGRFNKPETIEAAKEEFYSKDFSLDVATANAHNGIEACKQYTFATVNAWFDYLAGFDLADMVVTTVTPSRDGGLWQKVTNTATSKLTGLSARVEIIITYHLQGDKFDRMSLIYADPMVHAYLNGTVETLEEVKLPAF